MLIKNPRGWELPERAATPERLYVTRRRFVHLLAAGPIIAGGVLGGCDDAGAAKSETASKGEAAPVVEDPSAKLYPVPRNAKYTVDRALTDERHATSYNNFYEFGSHKEIAKAAQALRIRPWTVKIDGMVERERTVDIDEILRTMPLEERVYRFRCVEAWAMTVPWSGFPLKALVDFARPLGGAKYLRMETFVDKSVAPGQKASWYPWPYVEGLTMAEATNELAFIATGLYGRPIPRQNGAPLRLVVPWKYGFKNIKSLVRLSFTAERPKTFWEVVEPREYGFWANVNPQAPHPRWSQAAERLLGEGSSVEPKKVPTQMYNGYGAFVAHLYNDAQGERLFM
jgi:sulfoxide reductase catalytic subunit YedY